MKTRHKLYDEASPRKRVLPVIRSLRAPRIRTEIAWAMKKMRTKSSAPAAAAQLALSSNSRRPDTLAGGSHTEEPGRQSSEGGFRQQLIHQYFRRRKPHTERTFQEPCVPAPAAAAVATSTLPENDWEVNCEDDDQDTTTVEENNEESSSSPENCEDDDQDTITAEENCEDDGQDTTTVVENNEESSPPPENCEDDDQDTTTAEESCEDDGEDITTVVENNEESSPPPENCEDDGEDITTVVENDEESSPPPESPKAWRAPRSTRKRRDEPPPPVSAGVADTVDGNNRGKEPEAAAAAAADVGRPKRQRKPKVFKDFEDTSTLRFDWVTHYPGVPYPEDYERDPGGMELGEVETITISGGDSSDSSDSDDKPFSLKLQTDTQKTRKARRILVEDSLFCSAAKPLHVPQRNDDVPAPKESSPTCPHTPDKLQESNNECEVGDVGTPATSSESPAADKDSSWTASEDDSTRNVTFKFEISGRTPEVSRLLQNGFEESLTFKAEVKLKKKRPRPKVKRPEKVKDAKPAKVPKTSKRKNPPARGAFEDKNAQGGAAAAHSLRATASAEFVEFGEPSRKLQRQDDRANPLADSASVPTAAAEAMDNFMAMGSNGGTIFVDLTSSVPGSLESGPQASKLRAQCSSPLELAPGATEITIEKTTSESDLQHRSSYVDVCIPNFGGAPVSGGTCMEEPLSTPEAKTLDVLPASVPFRNSSSLAPKEKFFEVVDSSDSDEQISPTPIRRKRSNLAQRIRRSLLSEVGFAVGSFVAPLCVVAPVIPPAIPFFEMTAEQKGLHALALCQDPRFEEDPMGLVQELMRGTPKHLQATLMPQTNRLVIEVLRSSGDGVAPVDTANQFICRGPSPASPIPLPLQPVQSDHAREELQLVVYGQKSSEMVVYQEMRAKIIKYKPKVFLDAPTIRTFEKLMLQGGEANDTDRADVDWVAERKLWSDRAHHFNNIMRQVQGDRAFSKWGGSVLDSVVGAFLTQNVSDYLSSNAFMGLRAHFQVREDARTGTSVPTEEQSSLPEEITPSGCSVGTTADVPDLGTPRMAGHHVPMEGSNAGIDNQQENASPMADAGIQDVQVDTEVSIQTSMDTFLVESQQATSTFVNSLSRDESDPYSFSDDDRSAETFESSLAINDLVIDLGAVHLGSTSIAQGSCSSMQMTKAGVSDEPVPAKVYGETPPITETISEVPRVANAVQGSHSKAYHSGTQDGGGSDMAAQPGKASSKKRSTLEEKFQLSYKEDTLTPDESEKLLATALRAILGKQKITREDAAGVQRVPLKTVKHKKPRNRRFVDMNRFKTNVKLLTGGDRANYELKVNYKLNSAQKVTWEAVRAALLLKQEFGLRDPFSADSVDWEAVRRADVKELANVIKERGMNFILSGRIKSLLDRLHVDQDGSLDIEWLRKLAPLDAQNFLTSVRGLGIKSVECIRLLTLHHPSFPVDTNVGRIVVRLGWVPLEPLPEETQLHLLDQYPVQEHIQKYIWPRLCTLDMHKLYEFHYQLITFGKVFCTKSKPNCIACPLRSQCKHYESAYNSARLRLPGPEGPGQSNYAAPLMLSRPATQTPLGECVPIIEEPNSPEYIHDIEDIPFPLNCADEEIEYVELTEFNVEAEPSDCGGGGFVYVELNEPATQNGSEEFSMEIPIVQESEGCIEDVVEEVIPPVVGEEVAHPPSQELVLLAPAAASFPAPPLKSVLRLRTIHYVYELPDHHPLLAKMDKRDPEDPCFYLLAIWNPDEVPEAMPKISDDDAGNPFASCQSGEASVRGTLLVPCRTAMKGSFPLNGTYFQVNEVFADHESSIMPIEVPRTLLWDLKRRFVYFGTSVTSIFKDMSQEEIQCCFKKGYICVRAFDQTSRQPKVLAARLHQSGAKIVTGRAAGQRGRRSNKSKVAS